MASPATRNWTRNRADDCHIVDDTRITTGAGRYVLGAPNAYCNATFAPEPTTRLQKWGDAQVETFLKTDVESDLLNLNRPTTKTACGSYDPNDNRMNAAPKKAANEASFPQTHARLNDPPCTLRGTGFNRWEWLCQNPQEGVMMPFDWYVPGRLLHKDAHRACIPTPLNPNPALPKPLHLAISALDVPGAYGTTIKDAEQLSIGEFPARVLPSGSMKSAGQNGYALVDNKDSMLLDTREVAWPEAPSISAVKFPVPTGPASVAWQRNDYAQGMYNTNTFPISDVTGKIIPGPAPKTLA
jgi:hypothetical protein